jgi:3-phenylpropionate/trans-cinnamate dioxygenase ferredoxin reductase subunit
MEYSGWPLPWDRVVFRGERADGAFVAFDLRDGKLVGGANVNIGGVNEHVQRLLREGGAVDVQQLGDPDVGPSEWRTSSRPPAQASRAGS